MQSGHFLNAKSGMKMFDGPLTVAIAGASGDLARRKIVPAFFSLFCQGFLPDKFNLIGFARTELDDDSFRNMLRENLACRYSPPASCHELMDGFLSRCFYVQGLYDSRASFLDMYSRLREIEGGADCCRLFYLAVPPSVFAGLSDALAGSGLVACGREYPWTRVVIEKPFGDDRNSSDRLAAMLARVFTEDQLYRIDHYLGKELVQNLLVLRFANVTFEPVWNRHFIRAVHIDWREAQKVGARGRYFDSYGIIRDVVQNHLLQILALTVMDEPNRMDAAGIREAKTRALKAIEPADIHDAVLGQYGGYRLEPGVDAQSQTATFAGVGLKMTCERWRGVPILVTAGKAMDRSLTEVRILFRPAAGGKFCGRSGCPPANRMVIRVQPAEAIWLDVIMKRPGLDVALESRPLDLQYSEAFARTIPDAYERLLLDVLNGDKSLFISLDELSAAWDVFTPLLHEIDRSKAAPETYAIGSSGPASMKGLADRYGIPWPAV